MKVAQLLSFYERVADAPDAIPRLRRFILDLAVRGKLVPQDPREGIGAELIDRAAKEKLRLVSEQGLRKPREIDNGDEMSPPFEIPTTWVWVRLDVVGAIVGGGTPPAGDPDNFAQPGDGFPWLTPADLGGYSELFISRGARDLSEKGLAASSATVMPSGTILFTSRAPIGYVAIAANPISTNQGFKSIVPYIAECSRYIALVMRCFAPDIDAKAPGTTFKEVSGKIVAAVPLPLPPLGEQHRIVAKVDELMALCNQLEAAREKRETKRDRLSAASLARLSTPAPENFATDVRFALDALASLSARADQIKQIRQAILNLAVRGRLTRQDERDGSSAELLEGIGAERQQLIARRLLRKERPLDPIENKDLPFSIPESWCWSRIGNAVLFTQYGTSAKAYPASKGVPVLAMGNVQDGSIVLGNEKKIPETSSEFPALFLKKFDLLYNRTNSTELVGKTGIFLGDDDELTFASYLIRLRPSTKWTNPRYLNVWMNTSLFRSTQIVPLIKKQTGQANVNGTALRNMLVPLPPLPEQHRIVAKVDQLMALCDQLEASLESADDTRRRLLDALLHEALTPVTKPSKEHARAAVSGYLVSRLASKRNFGRTAHMKHLYFAESLLGLNLGGRYMREAAGPLDTGIYELEKRAEAAGWYTHSVETLPSGYEKVSYKPCGALKSIVEEGITVLGPLRAEMDRLIDLMGGLKTESVEIIATLFAAWNDALLDGRIPDDNWIIKEVREHWHVSKQRFTPADLNKWLGWMRKNNVVPLGLPPRTMQQTTMEF